MTLFGHHKERMVRSANCSPSVSRSGSVSSTVSEPRPSSLKDRTVSVTSVTSDNSLEQTDKKSKGGWSSRFSEEYHRRKEAKEQKKAEERARNERLKKEILRVMTSKHAAEVRAKLNASHGAAPVSLAHMSAAQLEMRFPHSGPPAVRGGHKDKVGKHKNADMPALTRIVSGDEVDDEEERMKQHRDDWKRRTRPDARMRQVAEAHTPPSEKEDDDNDAAALADALGAAVLTTDDGVDDDYAAGLLEDEKFRPKTHARRGGRFGYKKDQHGVWTKERDGPYIVHKV